MTKEITAFKDVKIPRNRIARSVLLSQTYNDGYWAGVAEGKRIMKTEMTPLLRAEETRQKEEQTRRNALQALSNVGEALAKIGQALADVTEPRRV